MPEQLSDDELERAFRDAFVRRASGAPTALRDGLPLDGGPGTGEDRIGRRGRVWLAAAAAAVVAVGVPYAVQRGERPTATPPTGTSADRSVTSSSPSVGSGAGWRTESFAGVELDVPSTWGWGGTPVDPGSGGSGVCEVRGATVAPDGSRDWNSAMPLPFVGRPVLQSDACGVVAPSEARPDVDAVWFGSPRPIETSSDVRTIELGGQRITVFSADERLRDRILGSARVSEKVDSVGCPVALPENSSGTSPRIAEPADLIVCAYVGQAGTDEPESLLFSVRRGKAAAVAYERALAGAPRIPPTPCPSESSGETIRVGIAGEDRTTWDTIDLGSCARMLPAGGQQVTLTPDLVRPWSGPESKACLVGSEPAMSDYFRGMLG